MSEGLLEQGLLRVSFLVEEVVAVGIAGELRVEEVVRVILALARAQAELALEGAEGVLGDVESPGDTQHAAGRGTE